MKSTGYIKRRSSGVTLVEAVVGVALLGTLLVSILLADARMTRQSRAARLRVKACAVADEFLRDNWPSLSKVLPAGGGKIPGRSGWRWRAKQVSSPGTEDLKADAYALEIIPPRESEPATRLELVLPRARERR